MTVGAMDDVGACRRGGMGRVAMRVLAPCAWLLAAAAAAAPQPHLIVTLVDDLGSYNVPWRNPEQDGAALKAFVETEAVRLERMYTYKYCSPTRSSLMSGRFPIHVNEKNPKTIDDRNGGVDLRMKFLPEKLKARGYKTALIGKGHLGARSEPYLPIHRGYDYHFGFLTGGEDHNTQIGYEAGHTVDLWLNHGPAYGRNGTNSCPLYAGEVVSLIETHDPATPLFLYWAQHDVHGPYEALPQYTNDEIPIERRIIAGMMTCVAEATMNVTSALKARGMWENTLFVWASDNGGPNQKASTPANNYPQRGGKSTDFEGGVRVAAFAAGGVLADALLGDALTTPIHVADVHVTFCRLAGLTDAECQDDVAGLPGVDGVNVADILTTAPRNTTRPGAGELVLSSNAFIDTDGIWKYVETNTTGGFWTGPDWPNAAKSGRTPDPQECRRGCIFDVVADPYEYHDQSAAQPERFARMKARMAELRATAFQSSSSFGYDACVPIKEYAAAHKGFAGPPCKKEAE